MVEHCAPKCEGQIMHPIHLPTNQQMQLETQVAKQPPSHRRRHPHPPVAEKNKWVSRFNKGRCSLHLVIYTDRHKRRQRKPSAEEGWSFSSSQGLGWTRPGNTKSSGVGIVSLCSISTSRFYHVPTGAILSFNQVCCIAQTDCTIPFFYPLSWHTWVGLFSVARKKRV